MSGCAGLLGVGVCLHVTEADQAARPLVPQRQPRGSQSLRQAQPAHGLHLLDGGMSRLQLVVGDVRVEVMDVMETDVSGEPMKGAGQAEPGRACKRGRYEGPLSLVGPTS